MNDSVEREVSTEIEVGISKLLPTARLKRTMTRRWSERAGGFQAEVNAAAGLSPDALAHRLEDDESLADAYVRAGEAAMRSSDSLHRDMLARTIAAGLRDDALVDEAIYYTDLIAQLAPVHLRLLDAFDAYERRFRPSAPPIDQKVESLIEVRQICEDTQVPYDVACSAAERLRSIGMLADVSEQSGHGIFEIGTDSESFRITQRGSALLTFCLRIVDAG